MKPSAQWLVPTQSWHFLTHALLRPHLSRCRETWASLDTRSSSTGSWSLPPSLMHTKDPLPYSPWGRGSRSGWQFLACNKEVAIDINNLQILNIQSPVSHGLLLIFKTKGSQGSVHNQRKLMHLFAFN